MSRKRFNRADNARGQITILSTEVSGYSRGLLAGLIQLGFEVKFIEIAPEWAGKKDQALEDWDSRHPVIRLYREAWKTPVEAVSSWLIWMVRRLRQSMLLSRKGGTVIVQFGVSLLPFYLDLFFLKICGVKIIALSGYGSDSRPPHMMGWRYSSRPCKVVLATVLKSFRIRTLYAVSDIFFCSPSVGHLVPGVFYNQLDLGHPMESDIRETMNERSPHGRVETASMAPGDHPLRVLHAASSASTKGSKKIEADLASLEKEGVISFRSLTALSKVDLIKEMEKADVLVDQAFSDYPLPVTSAESMFRGCVPLVAGFFEKASTQHYKNFRPPHFTCMPDEIALTVQAISQMPKYDLQSKALEGKRFIELEFSTVSVARRLINLIEGDPTDFLKFHPKDLHYKLGVGTSLGDIERLRNNRALRLIWSLVSKSKF